EGELAVFVHALLPLLRLLGGRLPRSRTERAGRQVDAELLRRAKQLVVLLAHLDVGALFREHVHVERERLHLLQQHLERLRDRRLGDVLATSILDQWKNTLDVKKQHAAATKLEKIFLQQLPIIPVMIGARWSTYSTKYFHCFPTAGNFYADPIFTTNPDAILLFTRICPGGKAGL